jgi:prepilin-type N-terminal cleavage/methylation domain-containing protein
MKKQIKRLLTQYFPIHIPKAAIQNPKSANLPTPLLAKEGIKGRLGFTLVEIAMVLVVIGILLSIGAGLIGILSKRAKFNESREIVKAAREAVIGYAISNKRLPAALSDTGARTADAWANSLDYNYSTNLIGAGVNLCTTQPSPYLTVTDNRTSPATIKNNVVVVILSRGDNGASETGTFPTFTVNEQSDTYNDIVEYIDISLLRERVCHSLLITTDSLPSGTEEMAYPPTTLEATDGTAPYAWSVAAGSLPPPPVLSLSAAGAITGTPTTDGSYNFTVQVSDSELRTSSKSLAITINPNKPRITTEFLSYGTANQSYPNTTLSVTGGLSPYTWTALGAPPSPLPTGLSMSIAGVISGTPTTAGTYSFTATVDDARYGGGSRPDRRATKTLSITINPAAVANAPSCTLTANPNSITPGLTSTLTWSINNGPATGTWNIAPGGTCPSPVPSGNGGSCATAALAATTTFTLTVTNAQGTGNCSATVYVGPPTTVPPSCTLEADPNPVTTGNSTTLIWSISNGPATVTFSPASGSCTSFSNSYNGNCTTAAINSNTTFQITASNANGNGLCATTVYTAAASAAACSLTASPSPVPYGQPTTLTWNITNGPADGTFSPPPGGACPATITSSTGGSCATSNLIDNTAPRSITYTLTLNNGNSCSRAVPIGCQEYRVWNNAGGTRDYRVDGFCRDNIANNAEITTAARRLNPGETITQYLQAGACATLTGNSLTYNQAMNADIPLFGGDEDCQVNFTGTDR